MFVIKEAAKASDLSLVTVFVADAGCYHWPDISRCDWVWWVTPWSPGLPPSSSHWSTAPHRGQTLEMHSPMLEMICSVFPVSLRLCRGRVESVRERGQRGGGAGPGHSSAGLCRAGWRGPQTETKWRGKAGLGWQAGWLAGWCEHSSRDEIVTELLSLWIGIVGTRTESPEPAQT